MKLGFRSGKAITPAIPTIPTLSTLFTPNVASDGSVLISPPSGRFWRRSGEDSSDEEDGGEVREVQGCGRIKGRICIPVVRARALCSPENTVRRNRRSGGIPKAPMKPPPFRRIPYADQVRARPIPNLTCLHDYFVQALERLPAMDADREKLERTNGGFKQLGDGPSLAGPGREEVTASPIYAGPRLRPTPPIRTLLSGIWIQNRREEGGEGGGGGASALKATEMAGGDGGRTNWRGGGRNGFNGGRGGWAPPLNHGGGPWMEGQGEGRGFYGPTEPNYGFQDQHPPDFGFGGGRPQQGMFYPPQQHQWAYQGQFPPMPANYGATQQQQGGGEGRIESRGQHQGGNQRRELRTIGRCCNRRTRRAVRILVSILRQGIQVTVPKV